ncbi:MAG: GspE/PulE family protein [Patescibacteria group bacterium]|jgi:type IV pilus assembly protein PilB
MANKNIPQKIKNYLLENKILDEDKLIMLEKSDHNWEDYLVGEKMMVPADTASIKSKIYDVPMVDLSDVSVPADVLNSLNQKAALNYEMVVFGKSQHGIKVGMVNPEDFQAHDAMEFLAKQAGLTPEYFVISYSDFRKVFSQYSGFTKEIGSALKSAQEKFARKEETIEISNSDDLGEIVKNAPVAKIVSVIIEHAVDGRASDIHIEPEHNESRVRYRVDGMLHTSITIPNYLHSSIVSRIKVLANLKLDETRIPQDGRIRVNVNGQEIDLRVSVLPMLDAEKVVMRVLDTSAGVPTLEELGFSDYHIEIIKRNITRPFGLFLLTGPTGSGKTTTLYSILNSLTSDEFNITTLEDPIEYYINAINQSQVNPEVGYTFSNGLRAILRQDPNIIMVGEIRDNETAELVVHAALTGHLVFSTLHTNNAWGAIPRMIDMKVEPFLMSSILNLVMAQRLVRKICPACKKEEKLPPKLEAKIAEEIKEIHPDFLKEFGGKMVFYKGAGCSNCGNTGYVGRSVIGEILELGNELKDLIAKDFTMEEIREQLKKQKFVGLLQDGIIKGLQGITTIEEVMRISQEQEMS